MSTRTLTRVALSILLVLFVGSLYLALNRIFQADECQNVYTARLIASGWTDELLGGGALIYHGPLRWIAKLTQSSEALYLGARVLFLALFWTNLALCVRAVGIPFNDWRFAICLLLVSSVAPWWDHGFEVRHDNIMLATMLVLWILLRRAAPTRIPMGIWFGLVCALSQGFAFKAFMYWAPLLVMLMVYPPAWEPRRRRLAITLVTGLLMGLLAMWALFLVAGHTSNAKSGFAWAISTSLAVQRFAPWDTLSRLIEQAPFLVALVAAALTSLLVERSAFRSRESFWSSTAPEGLFAILCLVALLANPTPFQYNLLHVVPAFAILALRWSMVWAPRIPIHRGAAVVGLVALQGITFLRPTLRHFSYSNDRQVLLMSLAESLTDPAKDYVYDAMGLVASRKSHTPQWMLHSLIMKEYHSGALPGFATTALAKTPAVLIPNYRFSWLASQDIDFIRNHYTVLSGDLLVLGQRLSAGPHQFQCLHEGRYALSLVQEGTTPPGKPASLDWNGTTLSNYGVRHLAKGITSVQVPEGYSLQITWLGPRANAVPLIQPSTFETLFINWY